MVNLLVAILISAVVGFLAGYFSAPGADPRPVSLREAVTGDLDAPPAQYNLPRPPSTVKKTAPVLCEAGKTIQQQIETMNFSEVKKICLEAERSYKVLAIDAYAAFPDPSVPQGARAPRELLDQVRDSVKQTSYWQGEVSISQGDRVIEIQVFGNFFDESVAGPRVIKNSSVEVDDPAKLCTSITPLFTVNGRRMPSGTVSDCGGIKRKKGNSFFFSWETFNDELLSPVMNALLVPVPGAPQSELEYLSAETGNWTSVAFHWKASSVQEFEAALERHNKK